MLETGDWRLGVGGRNDMAVTPSGGINYSVPWRNWWMSGWRICICWWGGVRFSGGLAYLCLNRWLSGAVEALLALWAWIVRVIRLASTQV
jgi:hypothetical protein